MMRFLLCHLGETRPKILQTNINYLRRNFPSVPITLIVSFDKQKFRKALDGVEYSFYKPTEKDDELLEGLSHDLRFRNGFWRVSLERIFAILRYHSESNPSERLLHIETDVLIFPSIPLSKLEELEIAAWMPINNTHDVASLFFLPNAEISSELLQLMRNLLTENPGLTDMTLLRRLAIENPSKVRYLPTIHRESSSYSLLTPLEELSLISNSLSYSQFSGVFDAASIGMWLCGQDPRNHRGFTKFFVQPRGHNLDPRRMNFGLERSGLFFEDELKGEKISIHCLHIHSKKTGYFKFKGTRLLEKQIARSRDATPYWSFSPSIFLLLSWGYLKRRLSRSTPRLDA